MHEAVSKAMIDTMVAREKQNLARVEAESGNIISRSQYAQIMETLRQYGSRLEALETKARTGAS